MASEALRADTIRSQLERTLSSPGFARNERLSRFLRFVVENQLEGRESELKESVIAIEVFGNHDYDPRQDSLVRTEAGRLRARLAQYYLKEGASDPVIIELPKGSYAPVFQLREESQPIGPPPPRSGRLWSFAGVAVVLIAAGVWIYWQQRERSIPIAVLPLANLSQDPDQGFFADGLTSEIIRNLSQLEGLEVRSQTSSFAFKDKPKKSREAAEQLAADYLVEGSVLRAGDQLRVNAQLIRVSDDTPIWSGQFDRKMADVFAIQDEISRQVVNALRLRLGRGRRRYETSVEAYDLYLRARARTAQRGLFEIDQSIALYREAIAKDKSFAPAYAAMAADYAFQSGRLAEDPNREGRLRAMREAAQRAIELDPLTAEAHDALGTAYAIDANWNMAEKSFRRARELNRSDSVINTHYALFLLMPLGRVPEAVNQLKEAERKDPNSPQVQLALGVALISAGHFSDAIKHCEKLPESMPNRGECWGRARMGEGNFDEAIQFLGSSPNPGYLGHALAKAGRRNEAEALALRLRGKNFQTALIYAGLGDKDRTLDSLRKMADVGAVRLGRDLTYPEFALLRSHPGLKSLRSNLGLPE